MNSIRPVVKGIGTIAALALVAPVWAQNISNYHQIENPYLLLLREPSVHEDLKLDQSQMKQLQALNDTIDGPFIEMSNWPKEKAAVKFSELVKETKAGVDKILTTQQRRRLSQVMLRVKGMRCLTVDQVSDSLRLTSAQKQKIAAAFESADAAIARLQKNAASGSRSKTNQQLQAIRRKEHKDAFAVLSRQQSQNLIQMLGKQFDLSQLGRTKFKAPELTPSAGWINGDPQTLAGLRGKVVVIHFFAFQ